MQDLGPDNNEITDSSNTNNWQHSISPDVRSHKVHQLVHSICPTPDQAKMHDRHMHTLVAYARKVESDFYEMANSSFEYNQLIETKMHKIQQALEDKRIQKLQLQEAQQQAVNPAGSSNGVQTPQPLSHRMIRGDVLGGPGNDGVIQPQQNVEWYSSEYQFCPDNMYPTVNNLGIAPVKVQQRMQQQQMMGMIGPGQGGSMGQQVMGNMRPGLQQQQQQPMVPNQMGQQQQQQGIPGRNNPPKQALQQLMQTLNNPSPGLDQQLQILQMLKNNPQLMAGFIKHRQAQALNQNTNAAGPSSVRMPLQQPRQQQQEIQPDISRPTNPPSSTQQQMLVANNAVVQQNYAIDGARSLLSFNSHIRLNKRGQSQPNQSQQVELLMQGQSKPKKQRIANGETLDPVGSQPCCICLERISNVMILECSHLVVCFECSNNPNFGKNCPFCRQKISNMRKVIY